MSSKPETTMRIAELWRYPVKSMAGEPTRVPVLDLISIGWGQAEPHTLRARVATEVAEAPLTAAE